MEALVLFDEDGEPLELGEREGEMEPVLEVVSSAEWLLVDDTVGECEADADAVPDWVAMGVIEQGMTHDKRRAKPKAPGARDAGEALQVVMPPYVAGVVTNEDPPPPPPLDKPLPPYAPPPPP